MNDKIDEVKINNLIHSLGLKYNLQDKIIREIINSQYKFAREKITELDIDSIETQEDFDKFKFNFYWRYIGKFYTDFNVILRLRKQKEIINNLNRNRWNKNKED